MTDMQQEQPQRGRKAMAAPRREERRRPEGMEQDDAGSQLAIPTWVKEKYPETEYTYRWFAGTMARMQWAHRNDWDIVDGVDQVPATDKDGQPANHVLHVKRLDWYDNDRNPLEAKRQELEQQMARGAVSARGEEGETLSTKNQYADAASQNRLR